MPMPWPACPSKSRTSGAFTASTDVVPVSSTGTVPEVEPLTSSPPSQGQSSEGALWRAVYIPGDRLTSWVYPPPVYSTRI
jgi:hypothetical protein